LNPETKVWNLLLKVSHVHGPIAMVYDSG
jgi:hypothetical protein